MNGKVLDPIGMHLGLALDEMTLLQAIKLSAGVSGEVAILKANDLALDRGSKDVIEVLSALIPHGGVWVDSKTYDTDGTMKNTLAKISGNGARIVSVHLLNSKGALTAALKATGNTCSLTGITALTTYTETEAKEIFGKSLDELVPWLVKRGRELGFKSVVCSATQLPELIIKGCLDGIVPIIPGTRSMVTSATDKNKLNFQAQTGSTEDVFKILAINKMQGIVVLGSEVTKAKNPAKKLAEIKASIKMALDNDSLELEPKIPLLEQ